MKYLSYLIFFAAFSKATVGEENYNLRFTKEDGARFSKTAENLLSSITDAIQRSRELAIQASNGTLGTTDRIYLNSEYENLKQSLQIAIDRAWFQDSFMETYHYLVDGLEFDTLVSHSNPNEDLVWHVKLTPLSYEAAGGLASQTFKLQIVPDPSLGNLFINTIPISNPVATDDHVSNVANVNSAIAIAHAINAKSGQTKVAADVQENVIELSDPDFSHFDGTLSDNSLVLNGVSVTQHDVHSVNAVVEAINNFSTLSGVKARIQNFSPNQIELYTLDGRNIDIKTGGSQVLFPDYQSGVDYVFVGSVRLRSAAKILLQSKNFEILNLPNDYEIPVAPGGFSASNLLTQKSATDALSNIDVLLMEINRRRIEVAY